MKISKLHIDQFRHLENLDFDFTYPEDFHIAEKRGKPLDKICFIGQSATGKTGLLELINKEVISFFDLRIINENEVLSIGDFNSFGIKIEFEANSIFYKKNNEKITINNKDFVLYEGSYNGGGKDVLNHKNNIYFFATEILSTQNIKFFEEKTIILLEKYKNLKNDLNTYLRKNYFSDNIHESIWINILDGRLTYLQKSFQFFNDFFNTDLSNDSMKKKLDAWKLSNDNPLIDFSKKFNLIFRNLNLEVDVNNTNDIFPLRNLITKENIPIENTSSGTKQLLLTSLPLYKLNTKDSIILIDEPERSLYPDMQMEIMEHYQNLAPEAQFIVATHSPFISASFEPEERFILYFNEEGKVAVRRGSSPIGDDPNDMLKNDFGVNYYNKFGEEAYKKYLNLKEDLAKEKDPIKKKELLLETVKLGDTYNF